MRATCGSIRRMRKGNRQGTEDEPPWLRDREWRAGVIRSGGRRPFVTVAIMALVWNALSAPGVAVLVRGVRLRQADEDTWFALPFVLAGWGLLGYALYLFRRWRKHGTCVFTMESVPGVIGGRLAGVIHVPTRVRPEVGFTLRLSCIRLTVARGAPGRHGHCANSVEEVLWRKSIDLRDELVSAAQGQTAIPVLFHIPYGLPSAGKVATNISVRWCLEVGAATPGIDFAAAFDVPVFVTPQSSPTAVEDASPVAPYAKPLDLAKAYARQHIVRTTPTEGSVVFRVGPHRRLDDTAGLLGLLAVWTIAAVIVHREASPSYAILVLLGLFILYTAACLANVLFRSFRIEASREGLRVSRRCLGVGRTYRIGAKAIDSILVVQTGSTRGTAYYALKVRRRAGKRRRLTAFAAGMAERDVAEAMQAELLSALGGKTPARGRRASEGTERGGHG